MTIGEYIQRVQSLYSKGIQSDDSRLSSRHIYDKLLSVRSKLLSQKLNKKQKISQWNYQPLRCVEMESVPLAECPCLPPIGCTIYRSKNKLPKPLVDLTKHMISSVTSLDGRLRFEEVNWKELKYKSGNKYTSKKPDYFIRDGYLYISKITEDIPIILYVEGLFEDPVEAYEFVSYCDDSDSELCYNIKDLEFPFDLDSKDTLIEIAANELIGVFNQSLEDRTNNSQDSVEERSK